MGLAPMTITTSASATEAKVWVLEKKVFDMIRKQHDLDMRRQREKFLSQVEVLGLSCDVSEDKQTMSLLADALVEEHYKEGDEIIKQGQKGADATKFYIILKGTAQAVLQGDKGPFVCKHYKEQGEYFGEIALLVPDTVEEKFPLKN